MARTSPARRTAALTASRGRRSPKGAASSRGAKSAGIPATIADRIRELITRGALSPDVHLGQTQLAERFNASRVPVREALKLLAAEGIVIHDPNRGFFVASLSSEEARQLYRMRHLLEVELLSTVEWPTPAQLESLNAEVQRLESLLAAGQRTEWALAHREFHRRVFDLSPHKVLVREVLRLWMLTDRYRSLLPAPVNLSPTEGNRMVAERHLLESLATRDRARLVKAFDEDRTKIEQMLLGILQSRGI